MQVLCSLESKQLIRHFFSNTLNDLHPGEKLVKGMITLFGFATALTRRVAIRCRIEWQLGIKTTPQRSDGVANDVQQVIEHSPLAHHFQHMHMKLQRYVRVCNIDHMKNN